MCGDKNYTSALILTGGVSFFRLEDRFLLELRTVKVGLLTKNRDLQAV